MRRVISFVIVLIAAILFDTGASLAQGVGGNATSAGSAPTPGKVILPPGITEEMLAPPPVPRFMLEKPSRPLTTDEMMQQAREAEQRAKPGRTGEHADMNQKADAISK